MLGVNYPGLSEMFYDGPNVFKTAEGYRRSDEASANNAQNLADAVQAHQFDQQMNPLKIRKQQLGNDTSQLEYDLAAAKQPKLLADAEKIPFDDKNFSALMSHFEGVGQTAVARGGLKPLDPLYVQLKRSGFPQEVLDELSTPEGAQRVADAGKSFRETNMRYQLQALKNEGAADVADTRAGSAAAALAAKERQAQLDRESRERMSAARLEAARKLMQDKRATASDKKSLEQYAQDLARTRDSIAIDDPRAAEVLDQRYKKVVVDILKIRAAGNQGKVDLQRDLYNELGIIPPAPAQAAPAATAPASQDNDPLGIRKK